MSEGKTGRWGNRKWLWQKINLSIFIFLSDQGKLIHVTENHGVDEGIRK